MYPDFEGSHSLGGSCSFAKSREQLVDRTAISKDSLLDNITWFVSFYYFLITSWKKFGWNMLFDIKNLHIYKLISSIAIGPHIKQLPSS